MRCQVIPDHSTVLHHESNALQLGKVRNRISGDGNEIGESPGLNRAHAILPAQHFCGICRDCAKNVARCKLTIAEAAACPRVFPG
jgi:5-methylcytosine-specific restriction endonuclease McrA